MSSKEVNDLVFQLLAATSRIYGRDGDDIRSLVGKLSRAATRERKAATEEIKKLHQKYHQSLSQTNVQAEQSLQKRVNASLQKKVNEQSAQITSLLSQKPTPTQKALQKKVDDQRMQLASLYTKIERLSSATAGQNAHAAHASQPPLAGGRAQFPQDHRQLLMAPAPAPTNVADQNRLPRPEGLGFPQRKAMEPLALRQSPSAFSSSRQAAPLAPAASLPVAAAKPAPHGFEHFNQDRLLAIQADSYQGSMSDPDKPAAPAQKPTSANALPLAPRKKQCTGPDREASGNYPHGYAGSVAHGLDELIGSLKPLQERNEGQKRMASPGLDSASNKKHKTGDATSTALVARNENRNDDMPSVSDPSAFEGEPMDIEDVLDLIFPNVRPPPLVAANNRPGCIRCNRLGLVCDGTAHCKGCANVPCFYLLCNDDERCSDTYCMKIHRIQYIPGHSGKSKKSKIIGDNIVRIRIEDKSVVFLDTDGGERGALQKLTVKKRKSRSHKKQPEVPRNRQNDTQRVRVFDPTQQLFSLNIEHAAQQDNTVGRHDGMAFSSAQLVQNIAGVSYVAKCEEPSMLPSTDYGQPPRAMLAADAYLPQSSPAFRHEPLSMGYPSNGLGVFEASQTFPYNFNPALTPHDNSNVNNVNWPNSSFLARGPRDMILGDGTKVKTEAKDGDDDL